jgi:hypothetical protein
MRSLKIGKKMKMEIASAVVMAIGLLAFAVYVNQPGSEWGSSSSMTLEQLKGPYGQFSTQQVITEDVQGELKAGSFEVVIKSLRNLTYYYDGKMPYLTMLYENGLWHGSTNCKIPTENVTTFTFDVRQLISTYGKVKRISISVTEVETNQTGQNGQSISTVTIGLAEAKEGDSPIINQIGIVVPWLGTGLAWIAEGLIIMVPLSFVCLGIIVLVDKGIIPLWKKQFRSRGVNKVSP